MLQALADNNLSLFEGLLRRPNCHETELNRCLLYATQKNKIECIKTIISHKDVDINCVGSSRKTPAMICAELGNQESLSLLISDSRCKINFQNSSGETALHCAVRGGNEKCVKELMKAGAKGSLCDNDGNTPLILASKTRYPNLAVLKQLLEEKSVINIQNKEGRTALHYTCGQAMGTELLLSSGANPDIQDSQENSPLHIAAIEGFDTIMFCLITYNCSVNLINTFGLLPLHYVAMKGHWKVVEAISHAEGLLDAPDKCGKTPLMNAIENNRTRTVISLLVENCCPNTAHCNSGITPIEVAFNKKLYHMVRLLLVFGGKPSFLWKQLQYDATLHSKFEVRNKSNCF